MTLPSDEGKQERSGKAQLVIGLIAWGIIIVLVIGSLTLPPENRAGIWDVPQRVLSILSRIGEIVLGILGAIWDSSARDSAANLGSGSMTHP